jgi:hypothetical protein
MGFKVPTTDGGVIELPNLGGVDSGNAVVPLAAESGDLWNAEIEALRGNMFAINADSGSVEDRIGRLLALLPVMFQVVEEARSTIARLRGEVYDLSCKSGLDDIAIAILRGDGSDD